MGSPDEVKFQLDLPVGIEWNSIELLRTSLLTCLSVIFHNTDFCNAVCMVTGELLENALKYGDWTAPRSMFRLRVRGNGEQVHIEVTNPVARNSSEATVVLKTIDWLRKMPSAQEAFMAKVQEIASSQTSASALGLVRIAYEGGCQLDAALGADDVLTVSAECSVT